MAAAAAILKDFGATASEDRVDERSDGGSLGHDQQEADTEQHDHDGSNPVKLPLHEEVLELGQSSSPFLGDFEKTAADIAISNGYDYVVCGHIHQPEIKKISTEKGEVMYLNSGDWVENLTALEYNEGQWKIYRYHEDAKAQRIKLSKHARHTLDNDEIFKDLVNEFLATKK